MNFLPTGDQLAFRDTAARFAREKLTGSYLQRARVHTLDRQLVREMGTLGLIGPDLPEEFGGMGLDYTTAGLVTEAIAYGDFNISYIQLLASLMGGMVAQHAGRDIAEEWLPQVIAGEKIIGLGR